MTDLDAPERVSLREALLEHIYRVYADTPVAERRASHWVMDPEWLNDVRMLDYRPGAFWVTPLPMSQPERLLDLPLELRKGAGPPHLEL